MFPGFWTDFISTNRLDGASFTLPEEVDQSGLGADLTFLSEEQSEDEIENHYPGLVVAKDGYVPVGSCAVGSGDYYYINTRDGPAGPLYRIYHDAVAPDSYDPAQAIAPVLCNYEELLRYLERPAS